MISVTDAVHFEERRLRLADTPYLTPTSLDFGAVPRPCQNGRPKMAICGQPRSMDAQSDLGRCWSEACPRKPDKEEVRGSSPLRPTQVNGMSPAF